LKSLLVVELVVLEVLAVREVERFRASHDHEPLEPSENLSNG
jgi:hypothetical protein